MITFQRWSDMFGDQVSKQREKITGEITLVYNSQIDDDVLYSWYREGIKPKVAATRYLAGEAHPKKKAEIDFLTFCRISRYADRYELEYALAAGYSGTGAPADFWRECAGMVKPGEDFAAFYRPLFEAAYDVLEKDDLTPFARIDRACRATARAALSVTYPAL